MQSENSESSTKEHREEFNEEATIKYYFSCGYEYNEILGFLSKHHSCNMSYNTLLRRLKDYGLHCRHVKDSPNFDNTFQRVLTRIRELVSGPDNPMGYRAVWNCLQMEGLNIPRAIVQHLLETMDPEETGLQKKHRLKRRVYKSPGSNQAWHLDGYDKS